MQIVPVVSPVTVLPLTIRRATASYGCLLLLSVGISASAQIAKPARISALPNSPGALLLFSQQQSSTSIFGLITDVNGGVVPGASILVMNEHGQQVRKVEADQEGHFRADDLQAGTYRLRIQAEGLKTFEPPEVVLKAGDQFQLPETALPIASANQSVDVVVTREEIAEEEIKNETKQRVLGILPNFYTSYVWDAAPMNTRQKFKLATRTAIDPWVFIRTGITAGIQQANGTYPEYGDGASGYAQRYAAAYGGAVTGRFIGSAVFPSIFHQDPRYFYRGTGSVPARTLHALISAIAARTDSGHVIPNYTRTLGDFTAGYISRTWHPGSDNGVVLAIDNMLFGIADAAGHNLLEEFLFKKISRGTPPFAKGKPIQEKKSAAHP